MSEETKKTAAEMMKDQENKCLMQTTREILKAVAPASKVFKAIHDEAEENIPKAPAMAVKYGFVTFAHMLHPDEMQDLIQLIINNRMSEPNDRTKTSPGYEMLRLIITEYNDWVLRNPPTDERSVNEVMAEMDRSRRAQMKRYTGMMKDRADDKVDAIMTRDIGRTIYEGGPLCHGQYYDLCDDPRCDECIPDDEKAKMGVVTLEDIREYNRREQGCDMSCGGECHADCQTSGPEAVRADDSAECRVYTGKEFIDEMNKREEKSNG